ncbi:metallophosphoesterase [Roseisolibacter sp. H3M3-2]|uniref:metallophosphoesterase family protein n=1 Tax=Roseisolibacter sp. H3M3-2 TaxID=3031323 RepID=UPI0023DA7A46|nr:metallophosphoesterase [Roseisolibacter sp. H3M3-2]MDF1502084.1 metallophosphoesterase [Roseisolibacter sp. H3M3-2]
MPTVRIAAVGDVHVSKTSQGVLAPILAHVADHADVLLLCGDLTDYGSPEEGKVLVKELGSLRLPIIAVLGNHDYEAGHPTELVAQLRDAGVVVLDGESHEVQGIGFAGIKGFAGGFGRSTLGSWGEPGIKSFVKEAVDETLKLETALARLRTPQKVALLHYAPIRATVEGEPLEIFPWLGCGRHEEPLLRYNVTAVFHGHAHNGSPEGKLSNGAPCYNVAMPLLRKRYPEQVPVRFLELDPEPKSEHGPSYEGPERRRGAGDPAPAAANGAGAGPAVRA